MGYLQSVIRQLPNMSISDIEESYLKWVTQDNYLIWRGFHPSLGQAKPWYARSLVPKRGNRRYAWNVKRKFESLYLGLSDKCSVISSPGASVLFITLTYDINRCSLFDAWANIGIEINRFLSAVKKRYGNVHVIRAFEAFKKSAYPHVHMVLHFEKTSFPVRLLRRRHFKNGRWVVREKLAVSDDANNFFHKCWHSFVDVEGVEHLRKAIGYIAKYITKSSRLNYENFDSRKYVNPRSLRTLAMCWVFRKRAYSIGHRFKAWLLDLCSKKQRPSLEGSQGEKFSPCPKLAPVPHGSRFKLNRLDNTLSVTQTFQPRADALHWVQLRFFSHQVRVSKWEMVGIAPTDLIPKYVQWRLDWCAGLTAKQFERISKFIWKVRHFTFLQKVSKLPYRLMLEQCAKYFERCNKPLPIWYFEEVQALAERKYYKQLALTYFSSDKL